MDSKLFIQAITKFLSGLLLVGLLLFLPAGTFAFPQAWRLIAVLFVPMFAAGLVLMKKNPDLLRKRLNAKEEQGEQKTVIALSGLMFIASFVAAGLNFRFGWIRLPEWVSYAACVLFLIGYALFAEVLRENAYLSRTVAVQEDQKVIDTGLYGVVRHPMYLSTLILFLTMPLVLGPLRAEVRVNKTVSQGAVQRNQETLQARVLCRLFATLLWLGQLWQHFEHHR